MKKLSVSLSGHQTSITMEDEFITELRHLAAKKQTTIASIIGHLDATRRPDTNLSSAVRVWILNEVKKSN